MKWVEQSDNNSKLFHRVVDGKRKKFIRKKKKNKEKRMEVANGLFVDT